jgi:hypothetical protein
VRNSFSPPDPYVLQRLAVGFNESYNYTGRTQVHPSLVGGEHTTVIVFFGDSLGASTDNAAYAPTNSTKVQDFSLQNGGVFQAKTPALSCTDEGDPTNNGFWGHRLGDKLINGGKTQRVITFSISIGSTGTDLWTTAPYLNRFTVAYRRLNSLELLSANRVFLLSSMGGLDQVEARSAATVKANLDIIIAGIRSAGFATTPVYLALSSWAGGGTGGANGTNVRTGITNAIAANANTFTGADTDSLGGGANRYDTNHYTAAGSDAAATLWYNVIQGVFP